MTRRKSPRTLLGIESLESRSLPAGNVVAVVTEGLLTILGDGADNAISVNYSKSTGKYSIVGNSLDGASTLVNGVDTALTPVVLGGVKSVQVRLGDGDDQLDFGGVRTKRAYFKGRLDVDLGDGDDRVVIGRAGKESGNTGQLALEVKVGEGSVIRGGDGRDQLELANMRVKNSLKVFAGSGSDEVNFATERPRSGRRQMQMFPVLVQGSLRVDLGSGDDALSALHARTELNFEVIDPSGEADLTLEDVMARSKIDIETGDESDHLALDFVFASQFNLDTKSGRDEVELRNGDFRRLNFNLGISRDELMIRSTQVSQLTLLDGGPDGSDFSNNGNQLRTLIKRRIN